MTNLKFAICAILACLAAPVWAASLSEDDVARMSGADVVILGEVHDNPAHHSVQRDIIERLSPKAVVWEMLTGLEADRVSSSVIGNPEELARVLEWAESGWPAFSMYLPLFQAAPGARIYGGEVPRQAARAVMQGGAAVAFGADAARFGLTVKLPEDEMAKREQMQFDAHCEAIPKDSMTPMVEIQRLRDAVLAREIIAAHDETGGPVVVITGNGHARKDWGIPVYLKRVQPGLKVFSLGQSEDGKVDGEFDIVIDSAPAERADPCAAFTQSN